MTSSLHEQAMATEQNLWKTKLAHRPKSFWYPYPTLHNVAILENLSATAGLQLLELCRGAHGRVADVGAADGDLAFFLERQGLSVDVIDNEYTNFNGLEGARILKEALNSSVAIRSIDLDSQFSLAGQKYDVVFFLGILYHLKNPFFLLESLARITNYCFVSTRIAKQTADGQLLSPYPVAYLLGPKECNNDATNFWIFSDHGLKRLIERTKWNLLSYVTVGDTASSTPADPERDERAFCLLKKRSSFLKDRELERKALRAERDKNYEEALALYAKAIKVKGNFAPFVYQNRGMLYLGRAKASQDSKSKIADLERAIADFKTSIKLDAAAKDQLNRGLEKVATRANLDEATKLLEEETRR